MSYWEQSRTSLEDNCNVRYHYTFSYHARAEFFFKMEMETVFVEEQNKH